MFSSRLGLLALLLASAVASVSCQGLAALTGLKAAGAPEKGSSGIVKGAGDAKATAAAIKLAADAASTGLLVKSGLEDAGKRLAAKKESYSSTEAPVKAQPTTVVKPTSDVIKKEEGFLGTKTPIELFKLLLNPFDLSSKIAEHFRLTFDKFFPAVKKGINFGLELAVQPIVLSLKIIEKVFVPDSCKLKFACDLARKVAFLRDVVPKLSAKVLNESKFFKALSDGIHNDCHTIYACNGEPKLKHEYKQHHNHKHHEQAGDRHHHEADHKHEQHKHEHGHGHDEHGEGYHHQEGQHHEDNHHDGHHEEGHGEGHHEPHGEGEHHEEGREHEHYEPEWSASSLSKSLNKKSS